MQCETQQLIIELLDQELRKANHPATLLYKKEIEDAKQDFIEFINSGKVIKFPPPPRS
jgi:hypothetical protein